MVGRAVGDRKNLASDARILGDQIGQFRHPGVVILAMFQQLQQNLRHRRQAGDQQATADVGFRKLHRFSALPSEVHESRHDRREQTGILIQRGYATASTAESAKSSIFFHVLSNNNPTTCVRENPRKPCQPSSTRGIPHIGEAAEWVVRRRIYVAVRKISGYARQAAAGLAWRPDTPASAVLSSRPVEHRKVSLEI